MPKKPATRFKIDDGVFQSKIRKMAKRAKVDEPKFVAEQGALYARDMAKGAPPFKNNKINMKGRTIASKADETQGKRAIARDVQQILVVQSKIGIINRKYADFGMGPIYKGREQIGIGVGLTISQIRRHHALHQNSQTGRTKPLPYSQRLWVSKRLLKEYLTYEFEKIGMAKAALATAMMNLQPKQSANVPKWVARHIGTVKGSGRLVKSSRGAVAKVRANASGLQYLFGRLSYLQKFRMVAMEKRLAFLVKQNAKKSGFKVR